MSIIKDLVINYENSINVRLLEKTLRKINSQIKLQSNPFIKENLRNWARKYRRKIKGLYFLKKYDSMENYITVKEKEGEEKKYEEEDELKELVKNRFYAKHFAKKIF